eukprot:CAMPEP_0197445768 /NCGR_PEP_ID=MMETSP1175-20131217/10912_1 /TAXON_ID=1003142 /ORGANISM="Triceratium dubium, Strain CCMP147" /LENGTH=151 /DNA_ID=CAMNT_0042976785 /DNA_START=57 /DNA_END=512 /DNA_ORIENTATION=-
MSFYSLAATKSDGSPQPMEDFRGKVVYATNVASSEARRHESTPSSSDSENVGGPDELAILAFPSREFGAQEYKDDADIAKFAASRNFPGILMKLGSVRGSDAPDVWRHMRDATGSSDPRWNFSSKYLVSKSGEVSVPKGDVESAIEALMKE